MKVCCTCKVEKNFSDFFKSKKQADGCDRQCKLCKKKSNNPHLNMARCKRYRENNPDEARRSSKVWRDNNPEYSLSYYYDNKAAWIERCARYTRERYHKDPAYRLKRKLSAQIWNFLHEGKDNQRTADLLGYTYEEFHSRLGTGCDNQHIDHKIPVTWFKKDAPINIVWHLDNLQWLDANENQTKSNRYAHQVSEGYLQQALPYIKEEFASFLKK